MKAEIILDAIGAIDDSVIQKAKQDTQIAVIKPRHSSRKVLIVVTAAIILIFVSFVTTMAVSEVFREFVFSIINIETSESIPTTKSDAPMSGIIKQVGDISVDGEVDVYYFKADGVLRAYNGLIYSSEYNESDAAFYEITEYGLQVISATRVEFMYSFKGVDFNIKFDYTIHNGVLHFRELPESLDIDPYKYGWSMQNAGNSLNEVLLILPYLTDNEYSLYPLLLNVNTNEITDVFREIPIDDITIYRWQFSGDMNYALIWGRSKTDKTEFWLCDFPQQTLVSVSKLTQRMINDSYILRNGTIICYAVNGDGFDVFSYNTYTNEVICVVENTHYYNKTSDESGLSSIKYYGGQGQYALLFSEFKEISLVNLVNGEHHVLDGLVNDGTLLTSESADGQHILVAFRDNDYFGIAIYKMGILDTQSGILTMLKRENYGIREEVAIGWLDNKRISIHAYDDDGDLYLFVYEFK